MQDLLRMPKWDWRTSSALAVGAGVVLLALPATGDALRRTGVPLLSTLHGTSQRAADAVDEKITAWTAGSGGTTGASPSGAAAGREPGVPVREYDELADRARRLHAQVLHLEAQLRQARDMVDQLTHLRGVMGAGGRLLPVRVVSRDAVPGRESVLLAKPSASPWDRMTRGQWAAARLFASLPTAEGVSTDAAPAESPVFWDHAVVGRVEAAGGGWLRVKLVTDPDFQSPAELLCAADDRPGGPEPRPVECLLLGRGRGKLSVRFVDKDAGNVRPGDVVRLPAGKTGLPEPMLVARVTAVRPDPGRPPLLEIDAEPLVAVERLHTVLVAVPEPPPATR